MHERSYRHLLHMHKGSNVHLLNMTEVAKLVSAEYASGNHKDGGDGNVS